MRLTCVLAGVLACTSEPAPCDCSSVALEAPPEPVLERSPTPTPTKTAPALAGPRLRVLGLAQDGGLPHAACSCERCEAARQDPRRASAVASVALIGSAPGEVWLLDATPDLPRQLELLADVREHERGRVDRSPLRGVLLTHAHMGHYLGLAFLGFEAIASETTPVYASARMVEFLQRNAPWDQLVRLGQIAPQVATPGQVIELSASLRAEPLLVPHRGEYTDTLGWYVAGPERRALFIPDTDPWAKWTAQLVDREASPHAVPSTGDVHGREDPLDAALDGVDLLLIDGTFYSGDELPGRDITQIGHPLMTDTMARLAAHVDAGLQVWFIHLNHSNPTLDPASPQRRELEARGFGIAEVGREFPL